jgi:uncharacterized membrane protein (DUF485 family)
MRLALTILVLAAYFGFLVFGASAPALLGQPIIGAIPLSFVMAGCLIVGTIVLTGIYVLVTNLSEGA